MSDPQNTIQIYRKTKEGSPWEPELPSQATTQARGFDVRAYLPDGPLRIFPLQTVMIPTGLYIALPLGTAMMVCSRSGLAKKGIIVTNAPGIIDSDYRGECNTLLTYLAPTSPSRLGGPDERDYFEVKHGDRICQWVFLPAVESLWGPLNQGFARVVAQPVFGEVALFEQLPVPESTRTGGFGSTGVA
jgi:dUTP pyrophosphatase